MNYIAVNYSKQQAGAPDAGGPGIQQEQSVNHI